MSLRVTQEAVEVLGLGDGKLRVTRLAVEILADEPELQEVADTLTLTDEATAELDDVIFGVAEDTFILTDVANGNLIDIFNESVSDTLTLTELASETFPAAAECTLTFTEEAAGLAQGEFDGFAQDFLILSESLGEFEFGVATDTLTLTDSLPPAAPDAFILSEILVGTRIKIAADDIEITGEVTRQVDFNRSRTDIVTITDAIQANIPRACDPKLNVATIRSLFKGHVVLTITGTGTSILLRNPAWGDREELNFSRINRTTRGGTRIQFSEPTWPKFTRFTLDMTSLDRDQVVEMRVFLLASLGKEVQLADWTGRYFLGIITNPDTVISQSGRKRWAFTLLYEGEETNSIFAVSSDTLFTEELDRQVAYGRSPVDICTITDTTDGTTFRPESVADTLTITDTATGIRFVFRSVADTLTITDTATGDNETLYTGILGDGILGWDFLLGDDND